MRAFYLLAILALIAPVPDPQYRVVFEGLPVMKVEVNSDTTYRRVMSGPEVKEYVSRVVVDRNGQHYWDSREMKKMMRVVSGDFVVYADAAGQGYVKACFLSDWCGFRGLYGSTPFDYVEHVATYGTSGSINYFGNRTVW